MGQATRIVFASSALALLLVGAAPVQAVAVRDVADPSLPADPSGPVQQACDVLQSVLARSVPAGAGCNPPPPPPPPSGPLPYWFGVVIRQDQPGTVPVVDGTLMDGCVFAATVNHGLVTCVPPTPAPGTAYWVCTSAGLVATATAGTVVGTTQCANGPAVTATATSPGNASVWNIAVGVWDFPWTCSADFSRDGAGNVLCDEPDPPVQWW